jgi:anaerobic selenocysteine-containing dehydrogenase
MTANSTAIKLLASILHQKDGRNTRELVLKPSLYGLGQLPDAKQPDAVTSMVCGFCSTGCSLDIHLQNGAAVGLSPQTSYPVNLGMACPKGWEALTVLNSNDRATTPLLRQNGQLHPVDWVTAIGKFVTRVHGIQKQHGPAAVAFLGTGQMPSEELAFLGALSKLGFGMLHGDANTRQCMATAAVAYKQSFGFDSPPFTYADFEESDVLVFVGANPCIAHPIMWERVMRNNRHPAIVVIDPRCTETAMQATQHLAISPKSDLTLFYGLSHWLIREGWIDQNFIDASTTDYAEFQQFVSQFSIDRVVAETGLTQEQFNQFARLMAPGKRVSFWWTMGVNQSYQGVRTAQALINLALMTGNIGKPGTGANSITGQCNAMGSRMFSHTTGLPCGREFTNPAHRQEVADLYRIPVSRIPETNSLPYSQILEGVERGEIKGLWIVGTNPAHSWVDQHQWATLRKKLDLLVVQDMYANTETAQLADIVLPAAGWGEKEGTFINSERRFGVIKKVAKAPGQALADFAIFRLIAEAAGFGNLFADWKSPAAVFEIMKQLSAGRPNDITGIKDYAQLDRAGGIQWPYPASASEAISTERRLFADGRFYHPDGKARFLTAEPRPLPEPLDDQYPLQLLTGRGSVAQWHTQTRTAKSAVLNQLAPKSVYIELNPHDAAARQIAANSRVVVETRRGQLEATAHITPAVPRGQVFLPMHYDGVNCLTNRQYDPYSAQPSYKDCAANVHVSRRHSGSAPPMAHGVR